MSVTSRENARDDSSAVSDRFHRNLKKEQINGSKFKIKDNWTNY